MEPYIVIEGDSHSLKDLIAHKLTEGYIPYGDPFTYTTKNQSSSHYCSNCSSYMSSASTTYSEFTTMCQAMILKGAFDA